MLLDESTITGPARQAALLALRAGISPLARVSSPRPDDLSPAEYSDAERAAAESLLMLPTPDALVAPARHFCFAAKAPPALAWDSTWTPIRA